MKAQPTVEPLQVSWRVGAGGAKGLKRFTRSEPRVLGDCGLGKSQ